MIAELLLLVVAAIIAGFFIWQMLFRKSILHSEQNRLHLMQALLDHSSSCIYVKDLEMKYVLVNPYALKVFGFKEIEVLGKTDTELFPAPYAIHSEASALKVLNEGNTLREEHVANLRGGDLDFYTVITPLKNAQNKIYGICGIAVDITKQKKAQKQLNDYLEKLEGVTTDLMESRIVADQVNSAQNAFLASMSHELRTPLNGIVGNASLLLNTNLETIQEKYLNRIQHSAHALMEIIEQILDFSKIAAGKIKLEVTKCDLIQLIKECHQILAVKAEEKKLDFQVEFLEPQVPLIYADPIRLKEILLNLLGNALKFTAKGSVVLKLQLLTATSKEVLIRIDIIDTGIGMSPDQMTHLFERFWQGKPCHSGGTGLGLAITKELVLMMNGEITADSTPGSGTFFKLKLPFEIFNEEI